MFVPSIFFLFYLNVFRQTVKYLLGHRHGFGEILFARLINHVLARIVPVEITDGLLQGEKAKSKKNMNVFFFSCPYSQNNNNIVPYFLFVLFLLAVAQWKARTSPDNESWFHLEQ